MAFFYIVKNVCFHAYMLKISIFLLMFLAKLRSLTASHYKLNYQSNKVCFSSSTAPQRMLNPTQIMLLIFSKVIRMNHYRVQKYQIVFSTLIRMYANKKSHRYSTSGFHCYFDVLFIPTRNCRFAKF